LLANGNAELIGKRPSKKNGRERELGKKKGEKITGGKGDSRRQGRENLKNEGGLNIGGGTRRVKEGCRWINSKGK